MWPAAYSTPIPRPFSLIGEQVSFITTRLDFHGPTASVFQMNDCIAFRTGIVTVTLHCPLFTDERNLSPVHVWRIVVVLLVFPPKIIYITVETQLSIYR